MHEPAYNYVARWADPGPCRVLEVGSREVNGSVRGLFPGARYLGVDKLDGPGVDLVADATEPLEGVGLFDYAISTEVFEHEEFWRSVLTFMVNALDTAGRVIVTAAGICRRPHSAVDGGPWLRPGEWYSPIFPQELSLTLSMLPLYGISVETDVDGVYGTGVRL